MKKLKAILKEISIRWRFMFVFFFILYNPFDFHFISFLMNPDLNFYLKISIGLLFFAVFLIAFRATFRSQGKWGVLLTLLIVGFFAWYLYDIGLIDFSNSVSTTIIIQLFISFVLGLGSGWAKIWKIITGQIVIEDPDS